MYEVLHGATTIWEGWDAVGEDGTLRALSLNHYAPGSALSWLFSRCAGIRAGAPGYQKILIEPHPGGTLTFADASYQSPVGLITSAWEIRDGRFELHVTLPERVPAVIVMPDHSRIEDAVSGTYSCGWE